MIWEQQVAQQILASVTVTTTPHDCEQRGATCSQPAATAPSTLHSSVCPAATTWHPADTPHAPLLHVLHAPLMWLPQQWTAQKQSAGQLQQHTASSSSCRPSSPAVPTRDADQLPRPQRFTDVRPVQVGPASYYNHKTRSLGQARHPRQPGAKRQPT